MGDLINLIRENITDVVDELGYDIYHIEYVNELGHNYLRIMIENKDKELRITVGDCEVVSKTLNKVVDNLNIKNKFFLEVSSPGVNRKLYTLKHMEDSINQLVSVKLNKSFDGTKRYKGLLKAVNENEITLSVDEKDLKISIDMIKNINLEEIS